MNASPTPAADNRPAALSGCHVLVVDDNEINRELAGLMLDDAGAEVSFAVDGGHGVLLAVSGRYDAILLDMQMPVMDGLEVTRRICAAKVTTPVIGVTASTKNALRSSWEQAGCIAILTKPVAQETLIATLLKVISTQLTAPQSLLPCRLDLRKPKYRKLLRRFIEKLECRLTKMESDAASERFQSLAEDAHWLAGTGPTLGYDQFAAPARTLSQAAAGRDLDAARAALVECRALQQRLPTR